jgi:hypothetical protein
LFRVSDAAASRNRGIPTAPCTALWVHLLGRVNRQTRHLLQTVKNKYARLRRTNMKTQGPERPRRRHRCDRGRFCTRLRREYAVEDIHQYTSGNEVCLPISTLSRLISGDRPTTEAQVVQSTAIRIMTAAEREKLRSAIRCWHADSAEAVRRIVDESKRGMNCLLDTTLLGRSNVQAFVDHELEPSLDELMRLFAASVLDDERLVMLNGYFEDARYRLMSVHGLHAGC